MTILKSLLSLFWALPPIPQLAAKIPAVRNPADYKYEFINCAVEGYITSLNSS